MPQVCKFASSSCVFCIALEYLAARLCISKMNLYIKYTHLEAMQIIFPQSFGLTNAAKALLFITLIQLFQHIISVALLLL